MEYLSSKNIEKKYLYGGNALNRVNFSLKKNEKMTVFGVESAGKTSLLKVVAGLTDISGGEILLNGTNISEISLKDRNFSMTFSDAFKSRRSVYENLFFSFKLRGADKKAFESKLKEADGVFDISHLFFKTYGDLTETQKATVTAVRCLMREANLYLLDNPLKGLSKEDKTALLLKILTYLRNKSGAVIYSTDDFFEACYLNFKTLVLNYGYTSAYGSLSEMERLPEDLYICKLFDMNIIEEEARFAVVKKKDLRIAETEYAKPTARGKFIGASKAGDKNILHFLNADGEYSYFDAEYPADFETEFLLENQDVINLTFDENKALYYDKKTQKPI
ncbi:MAG: ATP-binding cassette domain-containing protein [Clostridiales bacterium]|jgi:multiple sugar transport system ATP-binding protein|nr:ATP-binding cassette domain-containing protein [Clostridiales bacterium]